MNDQKVFVTKADGSKEVFDIQKLEHSLRHAKASPDIINKIASHILQELEDEMTTHDIYRHAFTLLHKLERPVSFRYSLKRAIMELGPSGFPFEQFVAAIYKAQGYEIATDQIVRGGCADHEVDVVAWKANKLIMAEVKFHHEAGLKSDLKVVLYVKARFEDLATQTYSYGGTHQKMSDGLLITNTKFTVSAIKYAECQKLNVIGWNYPLDGSLLDMIVAAKLHPLTCLHSLSAHDKQALLQQNIVLCKTLIDQPQTLKSIGLSDANIEAVVEEIKLVTVA